MIKENWIDLRERDGEWDIQRERLHMSQEGIWSMMAAHILVCSHSWGALISGSGAELVGLECRWNEDVQSGAFRTVFILCMV